MKKSIVVTGGAGFVGANLVKYLIDNDYKVHVFVRKNGSLWRLESVRKKIVLHEDVLFDKKKISKLIKKINPYGVFHLATYGAYPSQNDFRTMIDVNIHGTYNLLESLKDINYQQCIIAGSSSEYGKKNKPMREKDLLEPNNYYGLTKAAQTHLSQVYAKTYNKPLVILRLFNVYGYFEEKGRLVRSVIESALSNKPILLATGKEARDFIHVEDVISACIIALSKNTIKGEILNIGSGKQTTIYELAKKIFALTSSSSEIKVGAYAGRSWDMYHWRAHIKKTKQILEWNAKISLLQGLKKTIDWYKNQ